MWVSFCYLYLTKYKWVPEATPSFLIVENQKENVQYSLIVPWSIQLFTTIPLYSYTSFVFHPNLWTWYYYKWFSPLLLCTIAFVLILWKFFNCITTSSTPTEQFIRFYPWFCLLYLGTNTNDFLHFGCQRHSCICLCADTFKVMLLGATSFTPTEWFIRFFP